MAVEVVVVSVAVAMVVVSAVVVAAVSVSAMAGCRLDGVATERVLCDDWRWVRKCSLSVAGVAELAWRERELVS